MGDARYWLRREQTKEDTTGSREIDALIAEHLFGYNWWTSSCDSVFLLAPGAVSSGPSCALEVNGQQHKYPRGPYWEKQVPYFISEPEIIEAQILKINPEAKISYIEMPPGQGWFVKIVIGDQEWSATGDRKGLALGVAAVKAFVKENKPDFNGKV